MNTTPDATDDTLPDSPALHKRAQAILDEADSWGEQLTAVWVRLLRREKKVITEKLSGAKSRQNTKFWDWGEDGPPEGFEFKALDVGKWLDKERWLGDLEEELAPVFDRLYASVLDKGEKLFAAEEKSVVRHVRTPEGHRHFGEDIGEIIEPEIPHSRRPATINGVEGFYDGVIFYPNSYVAMGDSGWDRLQARAVSRYADHPSPRYWLTTDGKWVPVKEHEGAFRFNEGYGDFVKRTGAVRVTMTAKEAGIQPMLGPMTAQQILALSQIRRPMVRVETHLHGQPETFRQELQKPDEDTLRLVLEAANRYLRGQASHPSRLAEFKAADPLETKTPPRPRARIARERRDLAKLTARRISEAREYHEAWLTRLGQLVDEIAARDVVVMQDVLDAVEIQYTQAEGEVGAVAQSQAIASVNDAQLEIVKRSGLKGKKVWFTAMDERVRPSHRKVHGQRRALDKPFKVPYRGKVTEGWKNVDMQYPGDRSGPPGVWINCRCVLLFYPATTAGEPEAGLEAAAQWLSLRRSLTDDITRYLEEKDIRRVRTTEGARRFHRPVGAPIFGPDATPEVDPRYHERDTRDLVGRDAAQRSFDLRDAMRDWVYSFDSAKRIRMAAGELTDAYDDVLSPQLYDEPDNFFERESREAYGPPPKDMMPTQAEEDAGLAWAYASAEIQARALLTALTKAPAHDGPLYRHVNVPLDTLPAFDEALRTGQVDLPLEAVGDSAWFVARFDRTRVPEHPDFQPEPMSEEDRYYYEEGVSESGYRSVAAYEAAQRREHEEPEFHVPVLFRILPGARALTGGAEYTGGRREDWREYITGGRFEVVSDTVEKIPDQYPETHPMHSDPRGQRVVTLRQTHTYLPKGHRVMTASPATPVTPAPAPAAPEEKALSLQLPGHGQGHEGLAVAEPGVAEEFIVASPLDLFGDLFDPGPTLVDGGLGVAPEEVLGEAPAVGLGEAGLSPDFLVVALQDRARLLQFLGEDDTGGLGHDPSLPSEPDIPAAFASAPDEKGLLSRILHVRSREGEERFGLPLNAPIVPHPDAPGSRRRGRARVTVTDAAREADAAATPKQHRGITEGWGGKGRHAGEHFMVNGELLTRRPTIGKWAQGEGRYNFRTGADFPEYFGEWDPKTYVDGLKDGAFDGYYAGYTPFWVNTDGKVMALTAHDKLPNMTLKQADSFGYVRVLVMSRNIDENYTPLTNPMLSIEFVNDPNAKQREAIATVMAQLETSHALVSKKLNTQHFGDVIEATGGSVSVEALGKANGKSFLLDDAKVIDDFLRNPTDPPPDVPSAASLAAPVIRESIRALLQHRDLFDPDAADPTHTYRSEGALDIAKRLDGKGGGVLGLLEKVAAARHVRTPEGARAYRRPDGSPITSGVPGIHGIPGVDLPAVPEPKPLYDGPHAPGAIDPREFDDFLDTVHPRLTAAWRASGASGSDFWPWVLSLPGDDQAAVVRATGPALAQLRQQGKGWLVDLEGKSAVRHVRTPEGHAQYGEPIGAIIHPNVPDLLPSHAPRKFGKGFAWRDRSDEDGLSRSLDFETPNTSWHAFISGPDPADEDFGSVYWSLEGRPWQGANLSERWTYEGTADASPANAEEVHRRLAVEIEAAITRHEKEQAATVAVEEPREYRPPNLPWDRPEPGRDWDSLPDEGKSAVRHVRTPEGVSQYHEPIGSPIVPHPGAPVATVVDTLAHVAHNAARTPPDPDPPREVTFDADRMEAFQAEVDRLNKIAARLKVAPITFTEVGRATRKADDWQDLYLDSEDAKVEIVTVAVTGDSPRLPGGWTYVGTIEDLRDGVQKTTAGNRNKYRGSENEPKKLRKPVRVRTREAISVTTNVGRHTDGTDMTIPAGTEGSAPVWWPWTGSYLVAFPSMGERVAAMLPDDQLDFIDPKPGEAGNKRVTGEQDGRLVHGDDPRLAEFRHVPMHCEYCNKARDRRKVMVLQGDDGKLTRVGSSCLKDFLGYHGNPERVTAYADKVRGSLFADDDEHGWARRVPTDIPTDTFLDLSAAVVRTFGWVPKSSQYGIPTAQRVHDILHGLPASADRGYKDELARVKISDEDKNRARIVREWASQQDYADNYLGNLRTILGGPSVGANRYGLAASAIGAYERAIGIEEERRRKREAEKATRAASTWVGTPGKRDTFTATITAKISYESAYGTGYVVKMADSDGNVLKTFTSGSWVYQANVGDTATFKATVKAHDTYRDTKETNLTRVGQVAWHKDDEEKGLDRLGMEWAAEWGLADEVT